ncbi:MAG TPA: SDR family NAD(P)-dependent oxidoreductase, partial [Myxococcaceae bacterium]|nr:SDR family NAD(P)-dependent oxidoreductase [Myxococcaceae bacterium]
MSLRGQTALVTGAGKRIGEAIALALGEAGVNIVTHFRQSARRAEGLRDLLRRRGVQAFCIQADFEKLDEVDSLIDRACAEAGPIDILVNNASEFRAETIEALTHANFQHDLDINAWTPLALT